MFTLIKDQILQQKPKYCVEFVSHFLLSTSQLTCLMCKSKFLSSATTSYFKDEPTCRKSTELSDHVMRGSGLPVTWALIVTSSPLLAWIPSSKFSPRNVICGPSDYQKTGLKLWAILHFFSKYFIKKLKNSINYNVLFLN